MPTTGSAPREKDLYIIVTRKWLILDTGICFVHLYIIQNEVLNNAYDMLHSYNINSYKALTVITSSHIY